MAIIQLLYELTPWDLINTFIIPFILIFAILWGILTGMRIFNKRINAVLALGLVLFLSSTNFFPMVSQWMIQLGSFVAVLAFLLLFIGGTVLWFISRSKEIYYRTNPYKAMERIRKKMAKIDRKIAKAKDEHEKAELLREKRILEDKLEIIRAETRG